MTWYKPWTWTNSHQLRPKRWKTSALRQHIAQEGEMAIINEVEHHLTTRLVGVFDILLTQGLPGATLQEAAEPLQAIVEEDVDVASKKVEHAANRLRRLRILAYKERYSLHKLERLITSQGKNDAAAKIHGFAEKIVQEHRKTGDKLAQAAAELRRVRNETLNLANWIEHLPDAQRNEFLRQTPLTRFHTQRNHHGRVRSLAQELGSLKASFKPGGRFTQKIDEAKREQQHALATLAELQAHIQAALPH